MQGLEHVFERIPESSAASLKALVTHESRKPPTEGTHSERERVQRRLPERIVFEIVERVSSPSERASTLRGGAKFLPKHALEQVKRIVEGVRPAEARVPKVVVVTSVLVKRGRIESSPRSRAAVPVLG
jgi:hypothetical protein